MFSVKKKKNVVSVCQDMCVCVDFYPRGCQVNKRTHIVTCNFKKNRRGVYNQVCVHDSRVLFLIFQLHSLLSTILLNSQQCSMGYKVGAIRIGSIFTWDEKQEVFREFAVNNLLSVVFNTICFQLTIQKKKNPLYSGGFSGIKRQKTAENPEYSSLSLRI